MIIISSHNASSVIKILITRFQKGHIFTNLNGNPRNPTQCTAHIMAIEYFGSRKTNLAVKIGELTFLRHSYLRSWIEKGIIQTPERNSHKIVKSQT